MARIYITAVLRPADMHMCLLGGQMYIISFVFLSLIRISGFAEDAFARNYKQKNGFLFCISLAYSYLCDENREDTLPRHKK